MNKKSAINLSILLLVMQSVTATQSDTLQRFLDFNYKPTEEKTARFKTKYIIQKKQDGTWMVTDFFPASGKKMVVSSYTDSSLNNASGAYEVYDESGKKLIQGNYKENKPVGLWRKWHFNGALNDSIMYNQSGNITGIRKGWYNDGTIRDSAFYDENGNGSQVSWHSNGVKRSEGKLNNETKTGKWLYYFKSGKQASEEQYSKGSVTSIRCFDEDGKIPSGECVAEKEAAFPSGSEGWRKYITNKVRAYRKELKKDGRTGTVYVSFIVGIEGKVEDAKIEDPKGLYLEDFALQIIMTSPRWNPAKQHNIPVRMYFRQPITFQLAD